jgi:hypothetical protein
VDLPISLQQVHPLVRAPFKLHHDYLGGDGLETTVFKNSDRAFVIYDKRRQQVERFKADPETPPCTRFEMQIRNRAPALRELHELENPYLALDMLLPSLAGPVADQFLAGYARLIGFPALRTAVEQGHIEEKGFEKLVEIASRAASRAGVAHPAEVFAARWDRCVEQLRNRLSNVGLGARS